VSRTTNGKRVPDLDLVTRAWRVVEALRHWDRSSVIREFREDLAWRLLCDGPESCFEDLRKASQFVVAYLRDRSGEERSARAYNRLLKQISE